MHDWPNDLSLPRHREAWARRHGVVDKAEDIRLQRFVALKFLPEEVARDPQALLGASRANVLETTLSKAADPNIPKAGWNTQSCISFERLREKNRGQIKDRAPDSVKFGAPVGPASPPGAAVVVADEMPVYDCALCAGNAAQVLKMNLAKRRVMRGM